MTCVDDEYYRLVAEMTPSERMERAAALWAWSQTVIADRLVNELGPMSDEQLKWEIAFRRYGQETQLGPLIRRILADVRGRIVS